MPATTPDPPRDPQSPTASRFESLFQRAPTDKDLVAFQAAHAALVLRLPARVRRDAARVISRL